MRVTKAQVLRRLSQVMDPELGVSVVDLGLIYDIKFLAKGRIRVIMTLTSMGCPLFDLMAEPIKEEIKKIKGVKDVEIELTFDPPWNTDKMSKKAKLKLGFI